eukprot:2561668-Ditylum_brightwellii.AAC.1
MRGVVLKGQDIPEAALKEEEGMLILWVLVFVNLFVALVVEVALREKEVEVIVGLPQDMMDVDLVLLVALSRFGMMVPVAEMVELVLLVVGCYAALVQAAPEAPGVEGLVPHFLVFVGSLVLMRRCDILSLPSLYSCLA